MSRGQYLVVKQHTTFNITLKKYRVLIVPVVYSRQYILSGSTRRVFPPNFANVIVLSILLCFVGVSVRKNTRVLISPIVCGRKTISKGSEVEFAILFCEHRHFIDSIVF